MTPRFRYDTSSPNPYDAMDALETYLAHCAVDVSLIHLVKLRASQMNGCADCLDMHWKDSRALGETELQLYGLGAWRESPYYSPRERARLTPARILNLPATGMPRDPHGLRPPASKRARAGCGLELAARYVDLIRAVQPVGPYALGGASLGGAVAFEMAKALRRQGEEVSPVLLFSTLVRNESCSRDQPGRALCSGSL